MNFTIKKNSNITTFFILAVLIIVPLMINSFIANFHQQQASKPTIKIASHICNLNNKCIASLPSGSISLNLTAKSLTYMHPIDIELNTNELKVIKATAEFIGKDMSMGLLPFNLKYDFAKKIYKGTGSIIFCTIDPNMKWLLELKLETSDCIYSIDFELLDNI